MNKLSSLFGKTAHAADVDSLVTSLTVNVFNPVIGLMVGIALAVFIYGVIEFIALGSANEEAKSKGKQHMFWGVVGLFIMVSVFGIMHMICDFIGVSC